VSGKGWTSWGHAGDGWRWALYRDVNGPFVSPFSWRTGARMSRLTIGLPQTVAIIRGGGGLAHGLFVSDSPQVCHCGAGAPRWRSLQPDSTSVRAQNDHTLPTISGRMLPQSARATLCPRATALPSRTLGCARIVGANDGLLVGHADTKGAHSREGMSSRCGDGSALNSLLEVSQSQGRRCTV